MDKLIKEMYNAISRFGLRSKEALEASQRLDEAVVKAQKHIYNEYKKEQMCS